MRPDRWFRTLQAIAREVRPFGGLSGAFTSRIDLHPYQLEPALAMLRNGCQRIMIADAVGLGKTIQAGLIIQELAVESESFRALVVTPAGLRAQWSAELANRFGIHVETVTSDWLARAVHEVPADVGPWTLPGVYLSSFEYVRRPEVLRPLEDVAWDLLIVDEAHAATPDSARGMAVHAVALRSRRVILLTATPHGGDDEQYRSLCRIGRSDQYPDSLVIFRRTRSDVGVARRRRSVLLPVRLSASERRMHRLLERYTACICAEARATGNAGARLAAIVLRKRALSSAGSLAVSCRHRLRLLTAQPADHGEQLSLPLESDDSPEDSEPDVVLSVRGLADGVREQRWLETITQAAEEAASRESKIALLRRLVRRIKEPVIIFTEFRDTLARLQTSLGDLGRSILVLHGGMAAWERSSEQERFNRGGSLLLATDAAAEGLNLQPRCRTVVHFELPWSPSRLEQRTGRVDRIGQSRVVHEIMLIAADTAERMVLAPLAAKAGRAHSRVAGGFSLLETLSESRVASAVMDGTSIEPAASRLDAEAIQPPEGIHEDARRETERLSGLRQGTAGKDNRRARPRRVFATLFRTKPRVLPAGLVRLYLLALKDRDGTIVHSELVALHESGHSRTPIHRAVLMDFLRAGADDPALAERALLTLFSNRIANLIESCTRVSSALADRERAVSLPAASAAQRLVQAGLFDRREVRAGLQRERAAASILAETRQRIEAIRGRFPLTPSMTLTALLLVEDR